MQIQGTKKLLDLIPFTVQAHEEEDPFFSWHANVLILNRRKTLILMNDKTRYIAVLHGIKAKDIKRLDELIVEAIRKTMQAERIQEKVIDQYIEKAGKVTFHKTKNRTMVTRLNKSCESVGYFTDELDPVEIFSIKAGKRVSGMLVGGGKQPMIEPDKEMINELQRLVENEEIFTGRIAVMHIFLALKKHNIWRRVIVPLDLTFHQFHQILQVLFNWHDAHLHEFHLFDAEQDEANQQPASTYQRPALTIVSHEEALEYSGDSEMKMEDGLLLSDFIPPRDYMKYVYDFGDYWEHDIIIEEIRLDQSFRSPVCLEGEGTAPPEDCGGEPGFNEFVDVMQDPSHEEHQFMRDWARGQLHREFDKRSVNRRLERF